MKMLVLILFALTLQAADFIGKWHLENKQSPLNFSAHIGYAFNVQFNDDGTIEILDRFGKPAKGLGMAQKLYEIKNDSLALYNKQSTKAYCNGVNITSSADVLLKKRTYQQYKLSRINDACFHADLIKQAVADFIVHLRCANNNQI